MQIVCGAKRPTSFHSGVLHVVFAYASKFLTQVVWLQAMAGRADALSLMVSWLTLSSPIVE
jgi:vacuolar-type H+-ATPase subunit I/STV1